MTPPSGYWCDGGHVGQAGAARVACEGVDVETVLVGRAEHEARPGGEERPAGAFVARLFDDGRSPRREEETRREVEALLRAAHDLDLVGVAADAASPQEVAGERGAQSGEPCGWP